MKILARIVSTIFHPLLIPTLGLLLIFNVGGHFAYMPYEHQRLVFLIVFLSTCLLPLSLIPLFLLMGVVKTVYMEERRERLLPVAFTGLFYLLGYYFLARFSIVPQFIQGFMLATLLTIVASMLITFVWKISMHMIGIGGLTAALLALSFRFGLDIWWVFSLVILVSGAVGSSRLYLNAHTPMQVHAGFLLGLFMVYFGILL